MPKERIISRRLFDPYLIKEKGNNPKLIYLSLLSI